MPSFGKGEDLRKSHEIRLSGMHSMGLHISPSLQTYTAYIGIWQVSNPMYASMFWVFLPVIPPLFGVGFHDTRFHDAHMICVD